MIMQRFLQSLKPRLVKKKVKKEEVKSKRSSKRGRSSKAKARAKESFGSIASPSKIILDDWKRLYSNIKTNFFEVAIR